MNSTATTGIPPYFVGMKVEVGIPLSDTSSFRDWAIVNQVDNDLISLQLSRDILPAGVSLRVGQILTIRSEHDFQIYFCRAFIVSKGFEQELLLRLTGEIVANELREFYRIDAFLPIKFNPLPDQEPDNVRKRWEERRRQRREEERLREQRLLEARREKSREEERAREQRLLEGAPSSEPPTADSSRAGEEEQVGEYYESWGSVNSVAVNISGGGLRISTEQLFPVDQALLLEIFVPSSRCIVDVAARVIFSQRNDDAGENRPCFSTGLQFMFIDESARSAINRHTSGIQLRRIRQFKGFADVEPLALDSPPRRDRHYAYLDTVEAEERQGLWRKRGGQLALGLLFAAMVWLLYLYFSGYAVSHPKSVIQQLFENGIRKMRGAP